MNTIFFKPERERILKSAMSLAGRDGRAAPLAEVAYHARLSLATLTIFFRTRESLEAALRRYAEDGHVAGAARPSG